MGLENLTFTKANLTFSDDRDPIVGDRLAVRGDEMSVRNRAGRVVMTGRVVQVDRLDGKHAVLTLDDGLEIHAEKDCGCGAASR